MGVSKKIKNLVFFKMFFQNFSSYPLIYLICISKLNKESQNNKCFEILYLASLIKYIQKSINI